MKLEIKPKQITTGMFNVIKEKLDMADPEIEKLSADRMSICNKCESKSESGRCTECGCILSMKTRSPTSECPLKKWNAKTE